MSYPIIGITTNNRKMKNSRYGVLLYRPYIDAIIQSGGIPLLIPSGIMGDGAIKLAQTVNGILFSGGGDISPKRSESGDHPKISGVDEDRDALELELLDLVIKTKLPFLGICRGIQLLNSYFGGSLFADIPEQMIGAIQHDFHVDHARNYLAHEVSIQKGSQLHKIINKSTYEVNSLHHQGVKSVAPNLKAVAWAPDGLVEGLELNGYPFGLAVQWHPEEIIDHPEMKNLFSMFVNVANSRENDNG